MRVIMAVTVDSQHLQVLKHEENYVAYLADVQPRWIYFYADIVAADGGVENLQHTLYAEAKRKEYRRYSYSAVTRSLMRRLADRIGFENATRPIDKLVMTPNDIRKDLGLDAGDS